MLLGARVLDAEGRPGADRTDDRVRAGVLLATTGVARGDLVPFAQEHFAFMDPDFTGLTTPSLVVAGDHDQSALSTRGPDWFTDVYHRSPGARHLVTLHGGEHSLGGIQDYASTATTDESPDRVDLVRRATTAFLRTALDVEPDAWAEFAARRPPNPWVPSTPPRRHRSAPDSAVGTSRKAPQRDRRPAPGPHRLHRILDGRRRPPRGRPHRTRRHRDRGARAPRTRVTRSLAAAGASVVVAARDTERAAGAVAGIHGVEVQQLDLTEPTSIDAFARRWVASGRPLHALVNNAALLFTAERLVDARGNERSFSTSHLGHFQLTRALLPALRRAHGARVLTVTSGAARIGQIHWDDLAFVRRYDAGAAYAQSKRANVLFTVELDRRHAEDGIRAFAAHPGVVIGPGPHAPDRRRGLPRAGPRRRARRDGRRPRQREEDRRAGRGHPGPRRRESAARRAGRRLPQGRRRRADRRRGAAAHRRQHPRRRILRDARPDDARRLWAVSEQLTG